MGHSHGQQEKNLQKGLPGERLGRADPKLSKGPLKMVEMPGTGRLGSDFELRRFLQGKAPSVRPRDRGRPFSQSGLCPEESHHRQRAQ